MVGFLEPTIKLMSIVSAGRTQLTVFGSEAVVDRADTCVGIGGEVDPGQVSRKGNERSNQARVLVRVSYRQLIRVLLTIMLLSPKSAGLDVRQTGNVAPPLGLQGHLDEFGTSISSA